MKQKHFVQSKSPRKKGRNCHNFQKVHLLFQKKNQIFSVSPYEMWLTESKSSLEFDFDGDNADFSKFCIQTFRALSKNEKEEWKAKALTAAAQD